MFIKLVEFPLIIAIAMKSVVPWHCYDQGHDRQCTGLPISEPPLLDRHSNWAHSCLQLKVGHPQHPIFVKLWIHAQVGNGFKVPIFTLFSSPLATLRLKSLCSLTIESASVRRMPRLNTFPQLLPVPQYLHIVRSGWLEQLYFFLSCSHWARSQKSCQEKKWWRTFFWRTFTSLF